MSDEGAFQRDIRDFLHDNGIHEKGQLVTLVQRIAAIPWGEARTVDEVLSLSKGTCTGKHLLLQECLDIFGIKYRPVVCTFRWEKQSIAFPEHLRALLKENYWEHGHNFVQIKGEGDTWIDVDVTWDPLLHAYGFRTLPERWDGKMSFIGMDPLECRWDGVDITSMKEQIIQDLTPAQQKARAKFLREFIEWIDSIRV